MKDQAQITCSKSDGVGKREGEKKGCVQGGRIAKARTAATSDVRYTNDGAQPLIYRPPSSKSVRPVTSLSLEPAHRVSLPYSEKIICKMNGFVAAATDGDVVHLPVIDISEETLEVGRQMLDAAVKYGFLYVDTKGTLFTEERVDRLFDSVLFHPLISSHLLPSLLIISVKKVLFIAKGGKGRMYDWG